tara:strand:+ start:2237 stop:2551 length:315 start_codon:yes stop_codon:yes gene_type:complete
MKERGGKCPADRQPPTTELPMNIPNHATLEAHEAWCRRNAGLIDLDAFDFYADGEAAYADHLEDERRAAMTGKERADEDARWAAADAMRAADRAAASNSADCPF